MEIGIFAQANSKIVASGKNVNAVRKCSLTTDMFLESGSSCSSAVDFTIEHGGDD